MPIAGGVFTSNEPVKIVLVFGVIALFVCMSFTLSVAVDTIKKPTMPVSKGNILYVGGTGEGNYTTIQDAVDNASDGDTIFVYAYSSPYYENIRIDKSITLLGEDRNTTVIDGGKHGDVIYISADWVNISGFMIQNSGTIVEDAGIAIDSDNNSVAGNIISNNDVGIHTRYSSNNTIKGNDISNNSFSGIVCGFPLVKVETLREIISQITIKGIMTYNTISGNNIFQNNRYGILFTFCSNCIITDNNINNNKCGILFSTSENNTVKYNNIHNNEYGLQLDGGVNFITKNNFIKNFKHVRQYEGNKFVLNYWDNWIGVKIKLPIFQKFPKIIFSCLVIFPVIAFDWHPAKEPYNIGV